MDQVVVIFRQASRREQTVPRHDQIAVDFVAEHNDVMLRTDDAWINACFAGSPIRTSLPPGDSSIAQMPP